MSSNTPRCNNKVPTRSQWSILDLGEKLVEKQTSIFYKPPILWDWCSSRSGWKCNEMKLKSHILFAFSFELQYYSLNNLTGKPLGQSRDSFQYHSVGASSPSCLSSQGNALWILYAPHALLSVLTLNTSRSWFGTVWLGLKPPNPCCSKNAISTRSLPFKIHLLIDSHLTKKHLPFGSNSQLTWAPGCNFQNQLKILKH